MSRARLQRYIEILLVEDNPGDIELIREALSDSSHYVKLHVITDGLQALEFIRARKPKPDLVILDLNIPGKSGWDVLREVKSSADSLDLPIVVFTSSTAQRDVRTAYRLHANSFVCKPNDVDEFFATVSSMERYWTQTAVLPSD